MVNRFFVSASVLALTGGLAFAQAPRVQRPPEGVPTAATLPVSTTRLLASDISKATVYDNSENKVGDVTDLIIDSSGNITTTR
jgi:PRC-barrel domain